MTDRAVFFDMGGTIEKIGFTEDLRLQATPDLQRLLRSAGIDLQMSVEELYRLVMRGWKLYHNQAIQSCMELAPARVWNEFIFADTLVDRQKLSAIAQELMFFLETRFYQREMRAEVPAVLEAIKKMGLKIGLISNVCSLKQVPACLEKYGIAGYFNPIVLSSEYGRRKPDPAIFYHAAYLANVPTSACVYIGDRIARDILGANRASFGLAVQIRHDFKHGETDEGALPAAIVTDMRELIDILNSRTNGNASSVSTNQEKTSPVRAIFFDAGDILYYRPRKRKKLKEFLTGLGLDYGQMDEKKRKSYEMQAFTGAISQADYRKAIIHLLGVNRADQVEQGVKILEQEDEDLEFFDGIVETLNQLKQEGFLLGVITDTAAPLYIKINWLEKGGVGNLWDVVIASKAVGVRKPDPGIYQAAMQQAVVTPGQAVFVGHKISELDGASAVGMKTIAFNYEKDARADFYIEKFPQLLDLAILR